MDCLHRTTRKFHCFGLRISDRF